MITNERASQISPVCSRALSKYGKVSTSTCDDVELSAKFCQAHKSWFFVLIDDNDAGNLILKWVLNYLSTSVFLFHVIFGCFLLREGEGVALGDTHWQSVVVVLAGRIISEENNQLEKEFCLKGTTSRRCHLKSTRQTKASAAHDIPSL